MVRTGLAIARRASARIRLVHGVQLETRPVGFDIEAGPVLEQELISHYREQLRRQIERLDLAETDLAGSGVVVGAPHRVLTETARQVQAGLIVVGATGRGPFAAELLGSTADRVLRKAPCPVLIVREDLRVPPRTVLAPVDLSTLSGDAFQCGLNLLAQIAGTEEVQVRAVYALSFLDLLAHVRQTGEGTFAQTEDSAAKELRRFVMENRPGAPFQVQTAILSGEARAEILRELKERPVDLLVVGTHGRGGLERLVVGSVASTLVRKAACSVLAISPEAALSEGIASAIETQTMPAWHRSPPIDFLTPWPTPGERNSRGMLAQSRDPQGPIIAGDGINDVPALAAADGGAVAPQGAGRTRSPVSLRLNAVLDAHRPDP